MAEVSFYESFLIPQLRKLKGLYPHLRETYRLSKRAALEIARWIFQKCSRFGPPTGSFSCAELVRNKKIDGEIVMEGQNVPAAPSNSMRVKSGTGQDGHQPWPVFWSHHFNARLIGQTLVILDAQKRASIEGMYDYHKDSDLAYRSLFRRKAVHLEGNWTSIISHWCLGGSYYHWLMDGITRLALLPKLPPDTRVLVPAKLRPYEWDTLRWLGLENRLRLTPEHHLVIENFYFSSPLAMTGCCNPYGIEFLRSSFLPHADQTFQPGEKLYLIRKGKTRGILNESEVIDFLTKTGWTVLDPEELSLAQQISAFSNARAICGSHGSALTNLAWCRSDCFVLELFPEPFLNGCYDAISACIGLDYHYLICKSDSAFRMNVDLESLASALPK